MAIHVIVVGLALMCVAQQHDGIERTPEEWLVEIDQEAAAEKATWDASWRDVMRGAALALEPYDGWPEVIAKLSGEKRRILVFMNATDPWAWHGRIAPMFEPLKQALGDRVAVVFINGYTNMWFVPGYDYLNFASEDTRIAAPPLHSLQRFMIPEDLWSEGYTTLYLPGNRWPYPKTWLAYTTAESWKKTGPVEQFYDATDAASLVYRLGMAESQYYQDTVERQRRGRPAEENSERRCCGGYIVWKYNDSWPQVYSAKVDYFLEPYHAYYALRRAYAPVMLSFDIGIFIYLWAVNDSREPVSGTVRIQLYHLEKREFRKEIMRYTRRSFLRKAVTGSLPFILPSQPNPMLAHFDHRELQLEDHFTRTALSMSWRAKEDFRSLKP